jgi:glycine/D-amino acid oxidase-like deaminating enzyme
MGAACAYFLSDKGFRVHVLDRGQIASGTTSAGEGNVLVSDKQAGPELALALYSQDVWRSDLAAYGPLWEWDAKGGIVVAAGEEQAAALRALAVHQRLNGVQATDIDPAAIADYEPHIRPGLAGAVHYPEDAQVQPSLLAAHLLRLARERGAVVSTGVTASGFIRATRQSGGRITGLQTSHGTIMCDGVVNAAGPWAADVAQLAGLELPVLPRRGFVLVTEPLGPTIRHKVYAAEYVASTQSSDLALETSTVIEGTRSGTILIGSSREQVGFDTRPSLGALREIARKALALFPCLSQVRIMRSYLGFRPYCADHLPVIGADPRAGGLWHACGHEGAGIGLSVGTAKLLSQSIARETPDLDLTPFAPERFAVDRQASSA